MAKNSSCRNFKKLFRDLLYPLPAGKPYHWNSNVETYYLIGESMGEAMKRLVEVK